MLKLAGPDYRDWGIHYQSMVACEKQLPMPFGNLPREPQARLS
jgi:hypothetical protein